MFHHISDFSLLLLTMKQTLLFDMYTKKSKIKNDKEEETMKRRRQSDYLRCLFSFTANASSVDSRTSMFAKVSQHSSSMTCNAVSSSALIFAFPFPFTNALATSLVRLTNFEDPAMLEVREGGGAPTYPTGCATQNQWVFSTWNYQKLLMVFILALNSDDFPCKTSALAPIWFACHTNSLTAYFAPFLVINALPAALVS